jgi:SPP1 gp7 family putative phage head morphogenesis protein
VLSAPLIRRRQKILPPSHPNIGIEVAYRKRLYALLDEMANSLLYWLQAQYRKNKPRMAQDALPATDLRHQMRQLSHRWESRFDDAAPKLAQYFLTKAKDRTEGALQKILDDAGFTVNFRLTAPVRDVYQALIGENVGLIRSIASQHLSAVEGLVMRSVSEGRDLHTLAKALEDQYGVTKRRAASMARDQNNKATAIIQRTRQQELGIRQAVWMHSGAGKHPRPTHVANNGEKYDVAEGWFDPAIQKRIWPGTEINCRCTNRAVIPGL